LGGKSRPTSPQEPPVEASEAEDIDEDMEEFACRQHQLDNPVMDDRSSCSEVPPVLPQRTISPRRSPSQKSGRSERNTVGQPKEKLLMQMSLPEREPGELPPQELPLPKRGQNGTSHPPKSMFLSLDEFSSEEGEQSEDGSFCDDVDHANGDKIKNCNTPMSTGDINNCEPSANKGFDGDEEDEGDEVIVFQPRPPSSLG